MSDEEKLFCVLPFRDSEVAWDIALNWNKGDVLEIFDIAENKLKTLISAKSNPPIGEYIALLEWTQQDEKQLEEKDPRVIQLKAIPPDSQLHAITGGFEKYLEHFLAEKIEREDLREKWDEEYKDHCRNNTRKYILQIDQQDPRFKELFDAQIRRAHDAIRDMWWTAHVKDRRWNREYFEFDIDDTHASDGYVILRPHNPRYSKWKPTEMFFVDKQGDKLLILSAAEMHQRAATALAQIIAQG